MASRQIFSDAEKLCLQQLIVKYKLHKRTAFGRSQHAKKTAWVHLTEEFNTIETNAKRTENQLKKCWDNLKTRHKIKLTIENKQRMRIGGGHTESDEHQPDSITYSLPVGSSHETLSEQKHKDFSYAIDADTFQGPRNVRTRISHDNLRIESYKKAQKREDELHQFKKKEREFLLMAAEETYLKAKVEREAAEELLRLNRAKREEAEFNLLKIKNTV